MKYLGWVLFFIVLTAGIPLYLLRYLPLERRLAQQVRETEMWMNKTEQMKQRLMLDETRQRMAPHFSLLLADLFPGVDSFNLARFARDTLAALAKELRRTKGDIVISVFTDDNDVSLHTKLKYPDAVSYSAAKGAAVIRYLRSQGIAAERMVLQAYSTGQERSAALPDLRSLASRRIEISVRAVGE